MDHLCLGDMDRRSISPDRIITLRGYFVAGSYHFADAQVHTKEHLEQLE